MHKAAPFFTPNKVIQVRSLEEVQSLLRSGKALPCGLGQPTLEKLASTDVIVRDSPRYCSTHQCTEVYVDYPNNNRSYIDIRLLWYPPRLYGDPLNE